MPDSCCVGHQRHLLIEIRRADRNLAKSAPFKGIFPTTGPQILCPRTECVALFYLLEPTLMLYGVPRVSQCSPHPSFAYFRRWPRRSLPLPHRPLPEVPRRCWGQAAVAGAEAKSGETLLVSATLSTIQGTGYREGEKKILLLLLYIGYTC